MTTSQPRCADCNKLATAAIFVPSLAASEYIVAVCDAHDVMGDGQRFSLEAMAQGAAPFLAAFDEQIIDAHDKALRGWLVEATHGTSTAADVPLTVAQAAKRENRSERSVQRLCESGALGSGAWRTSEGARASWRIDPAALDKWRERKLAARAAPKVKAADVSAAKPNKRGKSVVW